VCQGALSSSQMEARTPPTPTCEGSGSMHGTMQVGPSWPGPAGAPLWACLASAPAHAALELQAHALVLALAHALTAPSLLPAGLTECQACQECAFWVANPGWLSGSPVNIYDAPVAIGPVNGWYAGVKAGRTQTIFCKTWGPPPPSSPAPLQPPSPTPPSPRPPAPFPPPPMSVTASMSTVLGSHRFTKLTADRLLSYADASALCRVHDPASWLFTVESMDEMASVFSGGAVGWWGRGLGIGRP
jgi:hypothetical protein